jgi:hypothetical protein
VKTEELAEHYRHLEDERLIQIAIYEVRDLLPEAVDTLRAELRSRDLPRDLEGAIDIQSRDLTDVEVAELTGWLRASACPTCGETEAPLNACDIVNRKSVGVSHTENIILLGCPSCLDKELRRESRGAIGSGCLSFPFGWIRATLDTSAIAEARDSLVTKEPTPALRQFVLRSLGIIHLARARGWPGLPEGRIVDRSI